MQSLHTTDGKPSGTKLLLSLTVLVLLIRCGLAGIKFGEVEIGEAVESMRLLVELSGVLGLTYAGRRGTEAYQVVKTAQADAGEQKS